MLVRTANASLSIAVCGRFFTTGVFVGDFAPAHTGASSSIHMKLRRLLSIHPLYHVHVQGALSLRRAVPCCGGCEIDALRRAVGDYRDPRFPHALTKLGATRRLTYLQGSPAAGPPQCGPLCERGLPRCRRGRPPLAFPGSSAGVSG